MTISYLNSRRDFMKIAVASENGKVSAHFGHCATFDIFETENGTIKGMTVVNNPGHKPGYLPQFLNENGVSVIISGGMGRAAITLFNDNNIEVIVGAVGNTDDNVSKYLKGELESTGSVCHEHAHSDDCGNH
jgi:predicted Fe-Mo cluster-binding NifX family protein